MQYWYQVLFDIAYFFFGFFCIFECLKESTKNPLLLLSVNSATETFNKIFTTVIIVNLIEKYTKLSWISSLQAWSGSQLETDATNSRRRSLRLIFKTTSSLLKKAL
jgi:hypothetical protein